MTHSASTSKAISVARSRPSRRLTNKRSAFTIIELVVVIGILGLLMGIAIPSYEWYIARAEKAKCMANLKNIGVALARFRNDHNGQWPQENPLWEVDSGELAGFWLRTMAPYDADYEVWTCPTHARLAESKEDVREGKYLSYSVTPFSPGQNTAVRWKGMPWAVENGNPHGDFGHILMPDGAVLDNNRVIGK